MALVSFICLKELFRHPVETWKVAKNNKNFDVIIHFISEPNRGNKFCRTDTLKLFYINKKKF